MIYQYLVLTGKDFILYYGKLVSIMSMPLFKPMLTLWCSYKQNVWVWSWKGDDLNILAQPYWKCLTQGILINSSQVLIAVWLSVMNHFLKLRKKNIRSTFTVFVPVFMVQMYWVELIYHFYFISFPNNIPNHCASSLWTLIHLLINIKVNAT